MAEKCYSDILKCNCLEDVFYLDLSFLFHLGLYAQFIEAYINHQALMC